MSFTSMHNDYLDPDRHLNVTEAPDEYPTVQEFIDEIGAGNSLNRVLRAIDKHNIEAVDVRILGCETNDWITPDDDKVHSLDDPIEAYRVRGIAWDDSDWEYGEIVDARKGFDELYAARKRFEDALDEYLAEKSENEVDSE